jgi:hypothetical protein
VLGIPLHHPFISRNDLEADASSLFSKLLLWVNKGGPQGNINDRMRGCVDSLTLMCSSNRIYILTKCFGAVDSVDYSNRIITTEVVRESDCCHNVFVSKSNSRLSTDGSESSITRIT